MLTILDTLHKRHGNLKANQLMNYISKCLCMILCGKRVKCLRAKSQLIIREHVQLLRYESFCLITVSYQFCSGLWDGVGVSTLPANITSILKGSYMLCHIYYKENIHYRDIYFTVIAVFPLSQSWQLLASIQYENQPAETQSLRETGIHHNEHLVCFC